MCLGMNGDLVDAGQYCVSTSNRNFEGRQGIGRTHPAGQPGLRRRRRRARPRHRPARVPRLSRGAPTTQNQHMDPITVIRSRTVVMPSTNIDTDQIIPARFLTTTVREGLGVSLFADWRYDTGRPAEARLRAEPAGGAGLPGAGGRPQHRLWLVARARALGAARFRHPRRSSAPRSPTSSATTA